MKQAVAAIVACVSLAAAESHERNQVLRAKDVLSAGQRSGRHHSVAPEVRTEGYFHVFELQTDYGPLEAEGRSLLLVRLQEIDALAKLEDASRSEVFLRAAGASVVSIGKGAYEALKDPKATAQGIGGGLKRFGTNLGRQARRLGDKARDAVRGDGEKAEDGSERSTAARAGAAGAGVAQSVLGVNAAARRWAEKVGADPYTTNPILKKALVDLGRIDAAGGIAAKIVLPVPALLSGTAKVGRLVWSADPEALMKENEAKLRAIGVAPEVIRSLYASDGFTLTTYTRLAGALEGIAAEGVAAYVETAATAETEREALFFVESSEMLRESQSPALQVLPESRALVVRTAAARAVVFLPVDWVAWTEEHDRSLREIEERSRSEISASAFELRTTGRVSARARHEMQARGWTLVSAVPASFLRDPAAPSDSARGRLRPGGQTTPSRRLRRNSHGANAPAAATAKRP